jgi:hypothetical protein
VALSMFLAGDSMKISLKFSEKKNEENFQNIFDQKSQNHVI